MKRQGTVALACLVALTLIQQSLGDDRSDTSTSVNKWTCTCSAYQGNQSFAIKANCSASCDCNPGSEGRWTCMCGADIFPQEGAGNLSTSCFTACNCTSGSSNQVDSSRKRISGKVVVIILLACVLLTTLAFIASLACYVYRRDKCPVQRPLFSSEKETSFNSATNLISHRASSVESKSFVASPGNFIKGCFHNPSLLLRVKRETLHGTIIRFSYIELEAATNKFSNSNLIGAGGSSHVYHGHLRDGQIVAVKRLETQGGPDSEAIFLTEIELISRLHHCHVVPLLGYCSENLGRHAERLLVFEYMLHGNLRECLDGASGKCLDWGTRVAIALGAAKGLEYLHEAAAPKILHRDVKSTNILLDENWRAKITDLGMAKHLRNDELPSCPSSPARMQGTFGYFAPEYAIVGRASLKSDVFSFGVVLLELISGRQPIHKSATKGEDSLVIWATPRLQDSGRVIMELPDPKLERNFPEEEMQIMAYLAKECLLLDPDSRPSMSEVVQILSTIAPEKSRWQNFPRNLFQVSTHYVHSDVDIERSDRQQGTPVEFGGPKLVTSNKWSACCSSPSNIDPKLSAEKNVKEVDVCDVEHVKRLILTSKSSSFRVQDDEAVDLTEPRFELFCMENTGSPYIITTINN
ncbi:Non-specific serine/threonine protein kinase [Bertholletia excelsa]